MKLHYRVLGEGKPFIILHGLFGYSDNWQSHALKLSTYYQVILVDLRNHGHSDWAPTHSYEEMAADVFELCQDLKLEKIILMGHSMGGKTAMFFADKHQDLLEKLIIVDMGIKSYPMHHQQILAGLNAVKPEQCKSRGEAEKAMLPFVPSFSVRQFLLKNLYWKEKGKLAWRMNIPVLEKEMPKILVSFAPKEPIEVPTLFIKGELSNYLLVEDWPSIEDIFIDAQLEIIKDADHWVHAEQPEVFLNTVLSFCLR